MNLEADDLPQPIPIDEFGDDGYALKPDAFAAKHGNAFLVRRGPFEPGRRPKRPQKTMLIESHVPGPLPARRGPAAGLDLVVIPVRHTGRSPYPSMITVGRTKNNDVVLADVVVSKFHAFFKDDAGQLSLLDAGSRNGTFVDGKPVPNSKAGKALPVAAGAKVRFGLIDFWLLDGAMLQDLARRSCPKAEG